MSDSPGDSRVQEKRRRRSSSSVDEHRKEYTVERTTYSSYLTASLFSLAVWCVGTLCFIAVVLYVNIDNALVERRTTDASRKDKDTTKYVLLAVTLVLLVLYIVFSLLSYQWGESLLVEMELELLKFIEFFQCVDSNHLSAAVLFCNSPDEVRGITGRQVFMIEPFSKRREMRAAEVQLALANLHVREIKKLVPPGVMDEAGDEAAELLLRGDDDMLAMPADEAQERGSECGEERERESGGEEAGGAGEGLGNRAGSDIGNAPLPRATEVVVMTGPLTTASSEDERRDQVHSSDAGSSRVLTQLSSSATLAAPSNNASGFTAFRAMRRRGKTVMRTGFDSEKPSEKPDTQLLKRRKATVLVVSFTGFAELAVYDRSAATDISSRFIEIVFTITRRFKGRIVQCQPDRIIVCWNSFTKQQNDHAVRGMQCGEALGDALEQLSDTYPEADQMVGLSPIIIGFTGYVLGGVLTTTERHFGIYGKCVDLAIDLIALLYNLNVTFIWMDEVPAHGMGHLQAVPMDVVTDGEGVEHTLYEMCTLSRSECEALVEAFDSFRSEQYLSAYHQYANIVEFDRKNMMADRLQQLSFYYAIHDSKYSRPVPRWVVFDPEVRGATGEDFVVTNAQEAWAEPKQLCIEDLRRDINKASGQSPPQNSPPLAAASPSPQQQTQQQRQLPAEHQDQDQEEQQQQQQKPPEQRKEGVDEQPQQQQPQEQPGQEEQKQTEQQQQQQQQQEEQRDGEGTQVEPPVPPAPVAPSASLTVTAQDGCKDFRDAQGLCFRLSRNQLGQTMTSEVYLGLTYTGGMVAIKLVNLVVQRKSEAPMNDINKRRLRRKGIAVSDSTAPQANIEEITSEIELLSKLRHSCIVGYVSSVVTDGKLMLIMEYVSGGSLKKILDQFTELSLPQVSTYLKDVLRGLRYLHDKEIVHRDVKPQNVLVPDVGPCKLTDFGISREISKATSDLHLDGTPYYMAPEAARGEVSFKSDIWSFGIMMVQVLTKQLPWPDNSNPLSIRYRLGNEEGFRPEVRGEIPAEAMEVFKACTQNNPDDRPSARELLKMPFFSTSGYANHHRRNSARKGSAQASQLATPAVNSPPASPARMESEEL